MQAGQLEWVFFLKLYKNKSDSFTHHHIRNCYYLIRKYHINEKVLHKIVCLKNKKKPYFYRRKQLTLLNY